METIKQEEAPKLSIVEQKKAIAAEFVARRIETLKQEKGLSLLASAREVYEEVKGQDYREEQAVAKLLEYLEMQNELSLRKQEIKGGYPELFTFTENVAANDEKYLVAA